MSNEKAEAEELLNVAMPFAEKMLGSHGEFYPFAVAKNSQGEIGPVGGWDGNERPASTDLIEMLVGGLRKGAANGEYIATAIVYDVRVTPPGATEKTDAIAAELEHRDDYGMTVFFPYQLVDGSPKVGAPFATGDRRGIFPVRTQGLLTRLFRRNET